MEAANFDSGARADSPFPWQRDTGLEYLAEALVSVHAPHFLVFDSESFYIVDDNPLGSCSTVYCGRVVEKPLHRFVALERLRRQSQSCRLTYSGSSARKSHTFLNEKG